MPDYLQFVAMLVPAGLVGGFLAGLFGIGGGLVFVPALFFVFVMHGVEKELAMSLAVATSLTTILFTATSSVISHYKLQNIDWGLVKIWSIPIFLGVFPASLLLEPNFGLILLAVFIGLLAFVAVNLLLDIGKKIQLREEHAKILQFPCAALIAFVSVLTGVGGGAMSVPTLMVMGLKTHKAIGTAAVIGLLIVSLAAILLLVKSQTLAGVPRFTYGLVNYSALGVLAITSIFSAPLGAKFGKSLTPQTLKRMFAVCLLFTAVSMYFKGFY